MSIAPIPRWAISFADLVLLLLGCFVLLHAMESARPKADAATVDAPARPASPTSHRYRAAELFEPGEAVLRPNALERLRVEGRRFAGRSVEILSRGGGESGSRLDRFELSAARVAAFARALQDGGQGPSEVAITMRPAAPEQGQSITVGMR